MTPLRTYRNREEAGRALASELERFRDADTVILGLPRGGLPVARPVAESLHAPLDVLLVRKLGVPGHEELAMGAIAEGGQRFLNDDVIAQLGIDEETIEQVTQREREELRRRAETYRGDAEPAPVQGRTALLIDDGLATGASMHAAVRAVKRREPRAVIVAVPVAAPQTVQEMRDVAGVVVCPMTPSGFGGVGRWYDDFAQVTDEDVTAILSEAAQKVSR